jgi:hypothetical protein
LGDVNSFFGFVQTITNLRGHHFLTVGIFRIVEDTNRSRGAASDGIRSELQCHSSGPLIGFELVWLILASKFP